MSEASLLLKPAEVAVELRISTREAFYLLKEHPELVVEIPGVRGKRVSRRTLEQFVDLLNPSAEGK